MCWHVTPAQGHSYLFEAARAAAAAYVASNAPATLYRVTLSVADSMRMDAAHHAALEMQVASLQELELAVLHALRYGGDQLGDGGQVLTAHAAAAAAGWQVS